MSVLSPLQFLFYKDELASTVGVQQISFFADDVAVWGQETDLERATAKQQKGLDGITCRSTSWKMELSAKKSECFFFITKTQEAKWRPAVDQA